MQRVSGALSPALQQNTDELTFEFCHDSLDPSTTTVLGTVTYS